MFSFTIGAKGYIGTGSDINSINYNDLWEYSPDTLTSIVEMAENSFQISPNPSQGTFIVSLSHPMQESTIEAYDIYGKKIFHENYAGMSLVEVTIENVHTDIYFIKLSDGLKSYTQTVVFIK